MSFYVIKAKTRTPKGDVVEATRLFELPEESEADVDAVTAPPTSD